MSASGLDVFDKTLQTTHIWLKDIMDVTGADRQVAWHVLGAVLRAVRDRVPLELAVHLGAELPILVRGAYYDQWSSPGAIERSRTLEEFLARIEQQSGNTRPVNVRDATAAVFRILARHIDRGQVDKIKHSLPEEVRAIWPDDRGTADLRKTSSPAQRDAR